MKYLTRSLMVSSVLFALPAVALFKAGQIYQVKQEIVFTNGPVISSAENAVSKTELPLMAYWSLNGQKFQAADRVEPSMCELRLVQKGPATSKIKIPKGSKYKVSSPLKAEDANIQTLKNCLIMDAVSEDKGTSEKPQIQFSCCSEKELLTPASRQEFNERMHDKLAPLLKLVSAK